MQFESWEEAVKKAKAKAEADALDLDLAPDRNGDPPRVEPPRGRLRWKSSAITLAILFAFVLGFLAHSLLTVGPGVRQAVGDELNTKYPAMPAYAKTVLLAKYKAERLLSKPGDDEEWRKLKKESRDLYAKIAASMPAGDDDRARLDRMMEYFRYNHSDNIVDVIDVWMYCQDGAWRFEKDGTKPMDIVSGAIEVMERLGIRRARRQSLRQFVSDYWTKREAREMTHQETLDLMVTYKYFKN